MKHLNAVLLLALAEKTPTEADVKAILEAAGTTADEEILASILAQVQEQSVDALLAEGRSKFANLSAGAAPAGGAAPAAAAAGGAAPAAAAKAAVVEEEEADFGMDLF